MHSQVYACVFAALHAQIPLQYTNSIGGNNSKLKRFDKNRKGERGECETPGENKGGLGLYH